MSFYSTIAAKFGLKIAEWIRNYPDKAGDYLWVSMWDCDCCVRDYGICWVDEADDLDFSYKINNKLMSISWGNHPPFMANGVPDIDAFMEIDLPKSSSGLQKHGVIVVEPIPLPKDITD